MKASDFSHFFENLERGSDGIFRISSSGLKDKVSYPDDGSQKMALLEEESFWFRHRLQCVLDLARRFPPQNPFIDLGGGNGFMTLGLKRDGFEAVLIEPGNEAVGVAKKRGLDLVIQGSFTDLSVKESSLPSVGIFDVLEHIEDDLGFLKKLNSKMAKGGRLFVTVPAGQYLWSDADKYAGHFRRYSNRELKQKLGEAGFEVEFSSLFFASLALPVFLMRTIPALFKKDAQFSDRRNKTEHLVGQSLAKALISVVLGVERRWLSWGLTLSLGTSCLAVARKV